MKGATLSGPFWTNCPKSSPSFWRKHLCDIVFPTADWSMTLNGSCLSNDISSSLLELGLKLTFTSKSWSLVLTMVASTKRIPKLTQLAITSSSLKAQNFKDLIFSERTEPTALCYQTYKYIVRQQDCNSCCLIKKTNNLSTPREI